MKLDANNNGRIIYRIAKSNLTGKKMYSIFSALSIALSITFVSAMVLFLQGMQTVEKRMLDNMQHVMFTNVSKEQMEKIKGDEMTEMMVPYKTCGENLQWEGVKYGLYYMESRAQGIQTYVPAQGREPEKYNEIVADRGFLEKTGQECQIGSRVSLQVKGGQEEFVLCGFTDRQYETSVSPVYVSAEYADKSPLMKDIGYTALVRIKEASYMESSAFETTVYQMALDYGIKRENVNINGKFEESLHAENSVAFAMAFVSLFIAAACGLVVYSIFYLSVTSRTRQIGQLQTIGMTQKQIKKMVRREGFLLSVFSIPAGLIAGGMIAYFLEPDGWSFPKALPTAVIAGIFGFMVVQISVGKPAALAAKVTPIEAARNAGVEGNVKEGAFKHRKLTAFVMAKTAQVNPKKRSLMTMSLTFGGIVFMIAASYIYAWDEYAYSRSGEFEDAEYKITYLYNAHNPSTYGTSRMQLTGNLSEALKEELQSFPYVKSVRAVHGAFANIEHQGATWGEKFGRLTEDSDEIFSMEMDGNNSYEYLTEHDGIIITNSEFSAGINGVAFRPGDKLTLNWFDGQEHSARIEIAAVTPSSIRNSECGFFMTDKTMEKLWGDMNTISVLEISVSEYETRGEKTEAEIRRLIEPYQDLQLATLREKIIDDAASVSKVKMQIYGISAFLILFSILNLINMTIGNISVQKRELAMLESVGMEERQMRSMLFWESIQFVFPAILLTLTVGGAAGYGFVIALKKIADYLDYRFPLIPGILYAAGVIAVPVIISVFILKAQRKISLVERIRYTD